VKTPTMKLDGGTSPDLAMMRRKKGVSLQEISQATKIGVNYLRAIEVGEFAKTPRRNLLDQLYPAVRALHRL